MKRALGKGHRRPARQRQNPRHQRIAGMSEGIMTLQVVEMLDVTLRGALVAHHGMLEAQSVCFLQLETKGELSTIRCRVVNTRVISIGRDEDSRCESMIEFLAVNPPTEQALKILMQALGARGSREAGGP
jgi:hypothetical protein